MIAARLGWRNLWRNSKRSWITISALGTALVFLMALTAIVEGLMEQMLGNGTDLLVGHLQVHDASYLPDRKIYDWLGGENGVEVDSFLQKLRRFPGIRATAPRVHGFALLSTGDRSQGTQIIGIDPDAEKEASGLLETVVRGKPLSSFPRRGLLLGETLARSLGIMPGAEIAVVTQAADGTLGNDLYTLVGIFKTGLAHLDRSLALTHWRDLQELMALDPSQIHEVAIRIDDPIGADQLAAELNASRILPSKAVARSWGELLPQLRDYLRLAGGLNWFLLSLVGVFAALGVLNTMAMAVFERTREVGALLALGMRPYRILASLFIESIFLTILGLTVGVILGLALVQYLSTEGIDLRHWTGEVSMLNTRVDPLLKAGWAWDQFLNAALVLLAAAVLATVLPGLRAARMDPVEALRAPTEG